MPATSQINYSLAVPSSIEVAAPQCPPVKEGSYLNGLKRWFVPGFASSEDRRASKYFIDQFKNFLQSDSSADREKIKSKLSLAERHIVNGRSGLFGLSPREDILRLEHYTLAVRDRLKQFDPSQDRQSLFERCRTGNQASLSRWRKCGFSEEIFWGHPDLVDFIFQAHLHRHINHPYYRHTISMQHCLTRREGQIVAVKEPHLLFEGRKMQWSEIRKKIQVDSGSRLYSIENGKKRWWTYLENGFTRINDDHFEVPQRLRKLDQAPVSCQVQIVTTHAHPEDRHILDRVLDGTRHTFIRIIPGIGFAARHPEMRMEDGSVYSFGWSTDWNQFDTVFPLSTLRGKWVSPDPWEFMKQDLCVTTKNVTDAKAMKLMQIIRSRSQEEYPFHPITANCCGIAADVLHEADIIGLDTKKDLARLSFEFFTPAFLRTPLDKALSAISQTTPECVNNAAFRFRALIYSIVLAPIFSLLGAWRTKIILEDDEAQSDIGMRASNQINALFTNVIDLFRPCKMEFDLTKNVYHWQLNQPDTVYEKRS